MKTYTRAINDLDSGKLPKWGDMQAPEIGKFYWRLRKDASMRDLLLAVRADEACECCCRRGSESTAGSWQRGGGGDGGRDGQPGWMGTPGQHHVVGGASGNRRSGTCVRSGARAAGLG